MSDKEYWDGLDIEILGERRSRGEAVPATEPTVVGELAMLAAHVQPDIRDGHVLPALAHNID